MNKDNFIYEPNDQRDLTFIHGRFLGMTLLYFAFFESHLSYGIAILVGATSSALQRVLIQQKRAVRYLAGLTFQEISQTAFTELKFLTVVSF